MEANENCNYPKCECPDKKYCSAELINGCVRDFERIKHMAEETIKYLNKGNPK